MYRMSIYGRAVHTGFCVCYVWDGSKPGTFNGNNFWCRHYFFCMGWIPLRKIAKRWLPIFTQNLINKDVHLFLQSFNTFPVKFLWKFSLYICSNQAHQIKRLGTRYLILVNKDILRIYKAWALSLATFLTL